MPRLDDCFCHMYVPARQKQRHRRLLGCYTKWTCEWRLWCVGGLLHAEAVERSAPQPVPFPSVEPSKCPQVSALSRAVNNASHLSKACRNKLRVTRNNVRDEQTSNAGALVCTGEFALALRTNLRTSASTAGCYAKVVAKRSLATPIIELTKLQVTPNTFSCLVEAVHGHVTANLDACQ
ncbi:hypothetical protein TRVL_06691 [Trypanosoma vivax]|nr:hypothetical protein TRVL_06691 [Trypanosoma vivax]